MRYDTFDGFNLKLGAVTQILFVLVLPKDLNMVTPTKYHCSTGIGTYVIYGNIYQFLFSLSQHNLFSCSISNNFYSFKIIHTKIVENC